MLNYSESNSEMSKVYLLIACFTVKCGKKIVLRRAYVYIRIHKVHKVKCARFDMWKRRLRMHVLHTWSNRCVCAYR